MYCVFLFLVIKFVGAAVDIFRRVVFVILFVLDEKIRKYKADLEN